jgi:hypothetical protein
MNQLELKLKNSIKAQPLPSQWQLFQEFEYDNRTGLLYRKNIKNIFRPAGFLHKSINRHITKYKYHNYLNSRIIFKMHTGLEPPIVDHIDGNPHNNRLENLRAATRSQNNLNRRVGTNNKKGIKNVHWHKAMKKWHIQIRANRKLVVSVFTDDLELAELVAIEGRDKYHGQYARHR